MVNASTVEQPLEIDLTGVKGSPEATIISLHASTSEATNSIADPNRILPRDTKERIEAKPWKHTVPALTIQVVDIPTE
jgi:alpha-L-arabinofuranosidase